MTRPVTQREIARILGISYLTVNRVLSDNAEQTQKVGEATRQRIVEAAQRLGYQRNLLASNLACRRSSTLGVVWPHPAESYYHDVLLAFERTARARDYHVVITHRSPDQQGSLDEIRFLRQRMVDGVILAPDSRGEHPQLLSELSQLPTLLFNSLLTGGSCHYLGTASRHGARCATEYLLEIGHRHIAFIAGPMHEYTSTCRWQGFCAALDLAGGNGLAAPRLTANGFSVADGQAAAAQLLALTPRPTAVLCANDALAIGVFLYCRANSVRIPEDLSLIGYAGMWEGELLSPPLTTVVQPVHQLGVRAAELLLCLIEQPPTAPICEELPDQLLVRQSCAAPAPTPQQT